MSRILLPFLQLVSLITLILVCLNSSVFATTDLKMNYADVTNIVPTNSKYEYIIDSTSTFYPKNFQDNWNTDYFQGTLSDTLSNSKFRKSIHSNGISSENQVIRILLEHRNKPQPLSADPEQYIKLVQQTNSNPIVEIEELSSSITEGYSAWFKLTASAPTTSGPLEININVAETDEIANQDSTTDSFIQGTKPTTVTFATGKTETYLRIPTQSNGSDSGSSDTGTISVSVQAGTGYTPATSPDNSASVSILDVGPTISISSSQTTIVEGTAIDIEFTATPNPTSDLLVPIRVRNAVTSEDGSGVDTILEGNVPNSVIIKANTNTANLRIDTVDDNLDEPTFTLKVFIDQAPGSQFERASRASLTFEITDNDQNAEFSIEAVTSTIVEGQIAQFRILKSAKTQIPHKVSVGVSATNFYLTSNITRMVEFGPSDIEKIIDVQTIKNNSDPAGVITATINSGSYTIASAPANSATININDVGPDVTLSSVSGSFVLETTGMIVFRVTLSSVLTDNISIPFLVSDGTKTNREDEFSLITGSTGDVLGENLPKSVSITAGQRTADINIPIDNDDFDESTGVVNMLLIPNSNLFYEVNPLFVNELVPISIGDNDTTPAISITHVANSILEGEIAQFRISTPNKSNQDLQIGISVTDSGNYIEGTKPTSVVLKAKMSETILNIPTKSVHPGQASQNISVTLLTPTIIRYALSTTPSETSAMVSINTASLMVNFSKNSPQEGPNQNLVFTFSIDNAHSVDIPIQFYISDGTTSTYPDEEIFGVGDYLGSIPTSPITINAGDTSETLTIPIQDDELDEPAGRVNYKFFRTSASIQFELVGDIEDSISIADNDDPPEISISSESNNILEGDNARFSISSNKNSRVDLVINLSVLDFGDFIEVDLPTTVSLEKTSRSVSLTIPTTSDETVSEEGRIEVEILTGENYEPADSPANKATVMVMTANHFVSVARISSVDEGNFIIIRLTSTPSPTQNFSIPLFVSDGETSTFTDNMIRGTGNVLGSNIPSMVNFTTGSSTATARIPTNDDSFDEGLTAGEVFIQFQRQTGANFDLGRNIPFLVAVTDDDEAPEISIEAVYSKIFEGTPARFKLTTNRSSGIDLDVTLGVTGDFIDNVRKPTFATIKAGTTAVEFDVATTNNGTNDSDGTITVMLEDGTTYDVASSQKNSASVTVIDEEVSTMVSIATSSGSTSFKESDTIELKISSTATADYPLFINLNLDQMTHNYLSDSTQTVVIISPNSSESTYILPVENDNVDENNGEITASITSGTGYTIAPSARASVNITIMDNDTTISISVANPSITEGENAVFRFTSKDRLSEDTIINISITDEKNFIDQSEPDLMTFSIPSGQLSRQLSLLTDDDETKEGEGVIEILVNSGANYESDDTNKASVNVSDNDGGKTSISISANPTSIMEGESVVFTVRANPPPSSPLIIGLDISAENNVVFWRVPKSISIPPSGSNTFEIKTKENFNSSEDGKIQATIREDTSSSYAIDAENFSEEVRVSDSSRTNAPQLSRISVAGSVVNVLLNNPNLIGPTPNASEAQLPKISIKASTTEIPAGSIAIFHILASDNPGIDLNIGLNISITERFRPTQIPYSTKLSAGQTTVTLEVPTHNHNIAEEDGLIAVNIVEGSNYALAEHNHASMIISDLQDRQVRATQIETGNQEILSLISSSLSTRTMNALNFRVQQEFNTPAEYTLEFNGGSSIQDFLKTSGSLVNEDSTSWRSVLGSSKFAVNLNSASETILPTTIWGIGDNQDIINETQSSEQGTSGNILTGNFGIDTQINEYLITGLSTSISESELEFDQYNDYSLTYNTQTSTINPYLIWRSPNQAFQFQSIAGWGSSEIEIQQENYKALNLASDIFSIGLEGSNDLLSLIRSNHQNSELNLNGLIGYVRQFIYGQENLIDNMKIDTGYYRFIGDGSHIFDFRSGNVLQPEFSIGLLGDYNNQQREIGAAISGGINYQNNYGIEISHFGNIYIPDGESNNEWGITNTLDFDHANDQIGLLIHLAPAWRQGNSYDTIPNWQKVGTNYSFTERQGVNGFELKSEVGYGINLNDQDGILTPFVKTELSKDVQRHRIGNQINFGHDVKLELYGEQATKSNTNPVYQFQVNGNIRW